MIDDLIRRLDAGKPRPIAVALKGVGTVWVAALTVADMDEQQKAATDSTKNTSEIVAEGAARLLCDEQGNRYGADPALVAALLALPWEEVSKLGKAASGGDAGND